MPDFSTLSRRQKTLKVNVPYRGSDGPLHLLVDIEPASATGSSEPARGIKVEGEGEWPFAGKTIPRIVSWPGSYASTVAPNGALAIVLGPMADTGSRRKIHIGIDEKSLEIRAAEFTTSDVGDAPMLPELLDQIPPEQEIATVTADGAFDTRTCHDAIAARGAAAIIPSRKNARPWKPDTAGALAIVLGPMADTGSPRNEILRTTKRVGRTIWRRWSGYHRRSRAEM